MSRLVDILIEPDVLVGVAQFGQVALEVLQSDDNGSTTVVGVEGKRFPAWVCIVAVIQERGIEEEVHVMLLVVDESEGRHAAGLKPQILHHALRRGEGELATRGLALCLKSLFQPGFEVMDVEVVVAMETDEIVLVAFVVTHEDVFAMHRTVVPPPTFCLFDGLAFRVIVAGEGNVVLLEVIEHYVLSFCCHVTAKNRLFRRKNTTNNQERRKKKEKIRTINYEL